MSISVGTYLPPWGTSQGRVLGYDEDALTMAVEAGRQVVDAGGMVTRVVFISRELPLLEGGNTAPLLAALRLPDTLEVVEQLGGAPATLDAILSANSGTLVIAVDAGSSPSEE
jgi:DNA-binding IclR family transcriptional regulator